MKVHELVENTVLDRPPSHEKKETPLYVPGGATVVILNDNVTPFEVVIEAIVYATRLSPGEAARRMMIAHTKGWAPVASYSSVDMAETVANNIESHARSNKNYDKYRPMIPPRGYYEPWPLTCEVMDADQAK